DGVVELRFDSPQAMTAAFASDAAQPLKADEPNFLGHGTGYAISAAPPVRTADDGSKLIVVLRNGGDRSAAASLEAIARAIPGCVHLIHDEVVAVIARPEMADGPQPADAFLHLYFDSADQAGAVGRSLLAQTGLDAAFTVVRVRTLTVI
ncbi:MAG: EthD domain-containing protein, partial [Acidobacteriota bacterium]